MMKRRDFSLAIVAGAAASLISARNLAATSARRKHVTLYLFTAYSPTGPAGQK
jgi:hypothetical protein